MAKQKNPVVEEKLSGPLQRLVDECVAARRKFETAELAYMAFVRNVEETKEALWRPASGSFTGFIETFLGKPDLGRYASYKAACDALGVARVEEIGLDNAAQATRLDDGPREAYIHASQCWTKENGGLHMSSRQAAALRLKVAPAEIIPLPVSRNQELIKLRAENAELRREVTTLRRRVKELEAADKPKKRASG